MNMLTNSFTPARPMLMAAPANSRNWPDYREPLVRMEKVVEYIGNDPAVQRQVFDLCVDLVATSLPQLRQATVNGDVATMRRIAHHARDSLGMLGLPLLQELGEEIEHHFDSLGLERWRLRCEELYELLEHVQQELQQRLAA